MTLALDIEISCFMEILTEDSQSNLSQIFMTLSIAIYSFVSMTARSRDSWAAILEKNLEPSLSN